MSVELTLIQDVGPTRRKLQFFCSDSKLVIDMRYIRIYQTMFALAVCYNDDNYIGPVLIDNSYIFDTYTFYPTKASVSQYTVLIDYFTPVSYSSPYHGRIFDTDREKYQVYLFDGEGKSQAQVQILKYVLSNVNDCGIDLQFTQEFSVQPKGTLVIKLPFVNGHYDHSDKPYFFVLRSRFANRCVLYLDHPCLYIVNNSNEEVELGSRFVQLVLPPCQNFDRIVDSIKKLDCLQDHHEMHKILLKEKQPK